MKKTYNRARRAGLNNIDILKMKEVARKQVKAMEQEAAERAFLYMLAIPLNILANDYWSKSAKKRIPKFVNEVMNLFHSVEQGVVTDEDLLDLLKDLAGINLREEWYKNKETIEGNTNCSH